MVYSDSLLYNILLIYSSGALINIALLPLFVGVDNNDVESMTEYFLLSACSWLLPISYIVIQYVKLLNKIKKYF
jgi:hypothetical protein